MSFVNIFKQKKINKYLQHQYAMPSMNIFKQKKINKYHQFHFQYKESKLNFLIKSKKFLFFNQYHKIKIYIQYRNIEWEKKTENFKCSSYFLFDRLKHAYVHLNKVEK